MSRNLQSLQPISWALAIAFMLIVARPHPAFAQLAAATICSDTTDTSEIIEELDDDAEQARLTTVGVGSTISASIVAAELKMETALGLHAQSENNSSGMVASVNGKMGDYLGAQLGYVAPMQATQATVMNDSAGGNGAFQFANQCQQATGMSGLTTMENAQAMELCAYNSYRCTADVQPLLTPTGTIYQGISTNNGPCSGCGYAVGGKPSGGGANVIATEFVKIDETTRVQNIAKAASSFFGATQLGTDGQILSGASDKTTPATHLDIDPLSLSMQPTYSDTYQQAHDMLSIYLVGLPPTIDSTDKTYTTGSDGNYTPEYSAQVLVNNEKLAFQNLSGMALQKERAYHDAVKSNVASAVTEIYKAANFKNPAFNGYVSPAALDDALYIEPANDPNFGKNFAGMNNKTLLGFIATEMLLLNKVEYKRYLQEMEMYKVQSASLNLQARTFSFDNHQ